MNNMFNNAAAFNNNISSWVVSNVNLMSSMFRNATTFNQNLTPWISNISTILPPTTFSTGANAEFANNANLKKPFFRGGTVRFTT
jgi:hypothetical protein